MVLLSSLHSSFGAVGNNGLNLFDWSAFINNLPRSEKNVNMTLDNYLYFMKEHFPQIANNVSLLILQIC